MVAKAVGCVDICWISARCDWGGVGGEMGVAADAAHAAAEGGGDAFGAVP